MFSSALRNRAPAETAYQRALRGVRPRWQTLLYLFSGLVWAFVLPAVLLCKVVPLQMILWTIAGAMLATGATFLGASQRLEKRAMADRRVDDLLLSGVLMIAAALLFAQIAAQTAAMQERLLPFWPSLAIAVAAAIAGGCLMHRRALRLARLRANRS
jgi:hypothetical protein